MRGHVRKRGSTWAVVVDVGHDGRRRQRWLSGFKSRREADRALREILGRMDSASYVEPSKRTVGHFLEDWLPAIKASVKPSTWAGYETHVRKHLAPALGSKALQRLTAADLDRLYAGLLERGLSPGTVRRIHSTAHRALRDATRWGDVGRNVADQASPPRQPRTEMATWSARELRAFLDHVSSDRLYALWLTLATTGMRRGEVLALRWRDVDFGRARASVVRSVVAVARELRFSEPKTARGRRSVALDPGTVAVLRDHRKRQLEERLAWGPAYQDGDLLFAREDGSPINPGRVSHVFADRVKSAGLRTIRLHDLRHTHATLALAAGVHPKVVSDRLGHSTVSLTLDLYSHAVPAMEEEAAARVAELIFAEV